VRELERAGLDVPDELAARLALYLHRIREWGRRMNLVSPGDLGRLARRHLLESYNILFNTPPGLMAGPLADAGSGAGFPGVPLALALPHLEVLLIESIRKKSAFLESAVNELGLGGRVFVAAERAETVACRAEHRGKYGLVTARGLGPLSRAIRWCAPLVALGGHLVGFKGTDIDEELGDALPAIVAHGLELADVVPLRWGEGRLVLLRRRP
jgi:16S rRNA (guanine527-N7)-methyltransferase